MNNPNSKRSFVRRVNVLGQMREIFDSSAMYTELETTREREWHGLDLASNREASTRSHFRGLPELGDGCPWPLVDGNPLELLACIHLSEMAVAKDYPVDFPRSGVLNLFFREDSFLGTPQRPGQCNDGCRLIYSKETEPSLVPPSKIEVREPVPISIIEGGPVQEEYAVAGSRRHRFGGLPEWIHSKGRHIPNLALHLDSGRFMNDPTVVSELKRANVTPQEFRLRRPQTAKQLDAKGVDPAIFGRGVECWRLLLQIDSDNDLGFSWVDEGRLYIFIPESSLAARRFEDAQAVVEFY